MRLAFLGTPEVATIPLHALVDAGHEVALVITQPDKRRGRGGVATPSPVSSVADQLGIAVSHSLDDVIDFQLDYAVVAAYGKIIPKRVLDAHTFLNIHPSLLPRWRGAAPVDHTILNGDTETGVCIIQLTEEMDAGPVYRVVETNVGEHEHAAELLPRLFELGSKALVEALAEGLGQPVPQAGGPTFAGKFVPDDFRLDWRKPAIELDRLVRIDRAFTEFRGKRLRVLDSRVVAGQTSPGRLSGAIVGTGAEALELLVVKPEGKPAMPGTDWANGARLAPGEALV